MPDPIPSLDALLAIPSFDGKEIARTTIKVTKAGDGLSEALKVDPQAFHLGDIVHAVIE